MDWMFFPGDTDNRAEPRFAVQRGAPFDFASFLKLCLFFIEIDRIKGVIADCQAKAATQWFARPLP